MIKALLQKAGLFRSGSEIVAELSPEEAPCERRTQQRVVVNAPGLLHRFDEDGSPRPARVLLLDASGQGLGVRLAEPLAIHEVEWLDIGGTTRVKAVVRHCRPDHDWYLTGLRIVPEERRRNDRAPVCGDGLLTWGMQATKVTVPGAVVNATALGLQIQVKTPVPLEAVASVTGESTQCLGSVCYCVPNGDGFLVGMHLTRAPYPRESADYRG